MPKWAYEFHYFIDNKYYNSRKSRLQVFYRWSGPYRAALHSLNVLPPPLVFFFQTLLIGTGHIQMPGNIIPLTGWTNHRLDVLFCFLFQKTHLRFQFSVKYCFNSRHIL